MILKLTFTPHSLCAYEPETLQCAKKKMSFVEQQRLRAGPSGGGHFVAAMLPLRISKQERLSVSRPRGHPCSSKDWDFMKFCLRWGRGPCLHNDDGNDDAGSATQIGLSFWSVRPKKCGDQTNDCHVCVLFVSSFFKVLSPEFPTRLKWLSGASLNLILFPQQGQA